MRVVLCYPSTFPGHKPTYGLPPMGILYIGAELQRHGHDVTIVDADIEGYTGEETVEHILAAEPDIVGFSIMTPQVPGCLETCYYLKEKRKDLPIVIGGAHILSTHADIFSQGEMFDFVCTGEGELTMLEVLAAMEKTPVPECLEDIEGVIYRNSEGEVITNKPRAFYKELDDLAPIDYSMVNPMNYSIPTLPGPPVLGLMITRGCPFPCTYCDAPTTTGKKIRFHSPERAVADIVRMNKQFGCRGFSFRDSTFSAKKKWVVDFCEQLIASGVDIEWRCNTRIDCVTYDLLKLMRKSGCLTINFGVESMHPKIQARLRKECDFEAIERVHRWCNELGIRTYTTFMIGNPGETDETVRLTLERAKQIRPAMAMFVVTIAFPGTVLYDEALAEGLVEEGWWNKQVWDEDKNSAFQKRWGWAADAGAMDIPNFDAEWWQKKATQEFYLRPQFAADTAKFIAKNPYFLKHTIALGSELLPINKLAALPGKMFKKFKINQDFEKQSKCPSAPTVNYRVRMDAEGQASFPG